MPSHAYYNEIDPAAAQWLRNLIEAGHIAPGYVDERSIEDVYPSDLRGFTQCHFFAGIGVWSHALRSAGWADDRPVWTGSCPCQPFSAAGKGAGFNDERHLWPAFHHLIKECRPAVVIGEQVASKDSDPWIDLVHTDMEAMGYAFGAIPFPSAGVGAPHIRDRLYWVAHTTGRRRGEEQPDSRGSDAGNGARQAVLRAGRGDLGGLGDASGSGLAQRERVAGIPGGATGGDKGKTFERAGIYADGLADAEHDGRGGSQSHKAESSGDRKNIRLSDGGHIAPQEQSAAGPVNGFWRTADWLGCRDGKWRPVEPGTFPLVDGAPARVVRLRAYGNAINAKAAQAFIECLM